MANNDHSRRPDRDLRPTSGGTAASQAGTAASQGRTTASQFRSANPSGLIPDHVVQDEDRVRSRYGIPLEVTPRVAAANQAALDEADHHRRTITRLAALLVGLLVVVALVTVAFSVFGGNGVTDGAVGASRASSDLAAGAVAAGEGQVTSQAGATAGSGAVGTQGASVAVGDDQGAVIPTIEDDKVTATYEPTRVGLSAVGDHLVHMPVVSTADAMAGGIGDGILDFRPMYEGVADIVASHDINIIDIETILGGDWRGWSGYPEFNSPSCIAEQVTAYGWNVCTTANNHAHDMGYDGIMTSIETWAAQPGMLQVGSYSSWEDRLTVRTKEVNGIKFAFLAYTDYLNGYTLYENEAYAIGIAEDEAIIRDVAAAREVSDVVIAIMSWGGEDDHSVNWSQGHFAQLLADQGVDLVIGFGPHVIAPAVWVPGYDAEGNPTGHQTLVVFSLGNFLSNQPNADELIEGCFTCYFERDATGKISIVEPSWTPLICHVQSGAHKVYKLRDYTPGLAALNSRFSGYADPIQYALDLTYQVIGGGALTITL